MGLKIKAVTCHARTQLTDAAMTESRQLMDLTKKGVASHLHINAVPITYYQLEVQISMDVDASILDLVAALTTPQQHVVLIMKDVDVNTHSMVAARTDSLLRVVLTMRDVLAILISLAAVLMELLLLRDLIVKVQKLQNSYGINKQYNKSDSDCNFLFKDVGVRTQSSSVVPMGGHQPRDRTLLVVLVMLRSMVAVQMEWKKHKVRTLRVVSQFQQLQVLLVLWKGTEDLAGISLSSGSMILNMVVAPDSGTVVAKVMRIGSNLKKNARKFVWNLKEKVC